MYLIDTKILPYFKKLKINQIDTVKVRNWQNVLLEYRDENGEPYKATYLKTIHNQLSCILNYAVKHYGIQPSDRIFLMGRSSLDKIMKNIVDRSGLPKITPHDLRHSNASMLIHMGVNIVEISRRLGHESVKTTWDTYSHLYPDSDSQIAAKLEAMRFDVEKSNAQTIEGFVDNMLDNSPNNPQFLH